MADAVERGVGLLSVIPVSQLDLPAIFDRLETITTDPRLQREIIETAEQRGVIERDGKTVKLPAEHHRRGQVATRSGDFTCKRCGADLSEAHFVDLEHVTLGPFGSKCFRTVTGRS
jgi:hypothetical protein